MKNRVELGQTIRSGVTGSVVVHLSVLALILISTEVHPHRSATESIAVDIVAPADVHRSEPEKTAEPERKAEPSKTQLPVPDFSMLSQPVPAPPPQPAEKAKPSQAAASPSAATAQAPNSKQGPSRQAATHANTPAASFKPPEPDVTVKYNVMLGLPSEEPPLAQKSEKPAETAGKPAEGFEEKAATADLKSNVVAEFKRHLKSCSKLPETVAPSDHIVVKLRVFLRHDGRLAAEPAIGGGSANIKAINLLQNAIAALKDCQPYTMLPADRYGEWKVLDLDFTPKDFLG